MGKITKTERDEVRQLLLHDVWEEERSLHRKRENEIDALKPPAKLVERAQSVHKALREAGWLLREGRNGELVFEPRDHPEVDEIEEKYEDRKRELQDLRREISVMVIQCSNDFGTLFEDVKALLAEHGI